VQRYIFYFLIPNLGKPKKRVTKRVTFLSEKNKMKRKGKEKNGRKIWEIAPKTVPLHQLTRKKKNRSAR
jgi:hypothetical protein